MSENLSLKLLAGLPIEVQDIGNVYPLTLREIADIGEEIYNQYLSNLLFELSDLEQFSEIKELESITSFDVLSNFCKQNINYEYLCVDALKCFFKKDVSFIEKYMVFMIGDTDEEKVLHRGNFEQLKHILRKQNCIKEPEKQEFNPGNSEAQEFIEEIKKKKAMYAKIKKKDGITLYSIISSIAWKSHIGINAVWDLTIYQLYDAYSRLGLIDNYDKTMYGIYSGSVDIKKINLKDIDWSKNINV